MNHLNAVIRTSVVVSKANDELKQPVQLIEKKIDDKNTHQQVSVIDLDAYHSEVQTYAYIMLIDILKFLDGIDFLDIKSI